MRKLYALGLLVFSSIANASCFIEASEKYNIHPDLLKAIAMSESSFNENALNCANSNESCDYGFMQINLDEWGDTLSAFNISIQDLRDPCQNLHFGSWVLAKNFQTHGRNWNSVGAYNAGFSKTRQGARDRYVELVKKNLAMIRRVTQ